VLLFRLVSLVAMVIFSAGFLVRNPSDRLKTIRHASTDQNFCTQFDFLILQSLRLSHLAFTVIDLGFCSAPILRAEPAVQAFNSNSFDTWEGDDIGCLKRRKTSRLFFSRRHRDTKPPSRNCPSLVVEQSSVQFATTAVCLDKAPGQSRP
jgi:hypothetical protein